MTICNQVITLSRLRYPKPVVQYKSLMFYGRNIVASEGDDWKRMRKVSAPAFSEVCGSLD
jgi:cytochrome P450